MIGIVGAMDEEIEILCKQLVSYEVEELYGFTFHKGKLNGKDLVIVKCGIGKTNSTIATTIIITNFNIDYIVNIGIAGGMLPCKQGDIVISKAAVYHDVDVRTFNYKYGQVPGENRLFIADEKLVLRAEKICVDMNFRFYTGVIASGDKFVTSSNIIKDFSNDIDNIYAIEMEGASIAHTCMKFSIPFIILRSISDVIDSNEQAKNYTVFKNDACEKISTFICKFIN